MEPAPVMSRYVLVSPMVIIPMHLMTVAESFIAMEQNCTEYPHVVGGSVQNIVLRQDRLPYHFQLVMLTSVQTRLAHHYVNTQKTELMQTNLPDVGNILYARRNV